MGCGTSRTDAIKSVVNSPNTPYPKSDNITFVKKMNTAEGHESNGVNQGNRNNNNNENNNISQENKMSNLNLNEIEGGDERLEKEKELKPINLRNAPIAFELPVKEEDASSLIKKHPPKRLRRIDEKQPQELTQETLEEKMTEAFERRKQVLTQRIQSARHTAGRVVRPVLFDIEQEQKILNDEMDSCSKDLNN